MHTHSLSVSLSHFYISPPHFASFFLLVYFCFDDMFDRCSFCHFAASACAPPTRPPIQGLHAGKGCRLFPRSALGVARGWETVGRAVGIEVVLTHCSSAGRQVTLREKEEKKKKRKENDRAREE
jgi:hypothetical protein